MITPSRNASVYPSLSECMHIFFVVETLIRLGFLREGPLDWYSINVGNIWQ